MQIYDCFTFYNELDLLELRFRELNDFVDHFVLVESVETFSGKSKPLYFTSNMERYSEWLHKVTHVVVPAGSSSDRWMNEYNQRNCIQYGLMDATRKDIIMISDVDEIPDKEVIRANLPLNDTLLCFAPMTTYYKLNLLSDRHDTTTVVCHYYEGLVPQDIRVRGRNGPSKIVNAGWHFSTMGDVDYIIDKLESFSHKEFDTPYFKNREPVARKMEQHVDMVERTKVPFEILPIDKRFPCEIREHPERYGKWIV